MYGKKISGRQPKLKETTKRQIILMEVGDKKKYSSNIVTSLDVSVKSKKVRNVLSCVKNFKYVKLK